MSSTENNTEVIKLLAEIKSAIESNNTCLQNMYTTLQADRSMMWKILALTIIGAFAIIGVKLVA
jgi:hypothetical protein